MVFLHPSLLLKLTPSGSSKPTPEVVLRAGTLPSQCMERAGDAWRKAQADAADVVVGVRQ